MPLYSPILAGDPVLANASWTSTLCVPLSIQRLAGLTRVRGRFLMRGLGTGACGGLPAQLPIVDDGAARTSPSTGGVVVRSEEHTSELQSRENLVCRLL